jgi:hypothetical protein
MFGVGLPSFWLWSLGAPLSVPIVIVLLGFLIGMQTVFPAVGSDLRAWWQGKGKVRLVLLKSGLLKPYSVNYQIGMNPGFDSHVEQIRKRQDERFFPSPVGIRLQYVSLRGEILGLLLDLTIPMSLVVVIVATLWTYPPPYTLPLVFSAWIVVMYGPSMVMVLWRMFATRRIRNAEAAMLDGEYETASLIVSGLPARVLQSPHASSLLAALAVLCGDLDGAATALATLQRSTVHQLMFGASFSRFGFRLNAAIPPKPETLRKLAEYESAHAATQRHEGRSATKAPLL